MIEGGLWFVILVGVVWFWIVCWFLSRCDFDVCCVDFAMEGS